MEMIYYRVQLQPHLLRRQSLYYSWRHVLKHLVKIIAQLSMNHALNHGSCPRWQCSNSSCITPSLSFSSFCTLSSRNKINSTLKYKVDLTVLLNNLHHESVINAHQSGQVLRMSGTSRFGKHTFSRSMPIHCPTLTPWSARSSTSKVCAQSLSVGSPSSRTT